jgi:hypothetical protein
MGGAESGGGAREAIGHVGEVEAAVEWINLCAGGVRPGLSH